MAVPSSGNELSLTKIYSEVNVNDYDDNNSDGDEDLSLQELSEGDISNINRGNLPANRPNEAAPHSMSEFYGYDQDATEPSFTDNMADFTISTTAGMGVPAVYSTTEQVRLSNAVGNFYGSITQTPSAGTLSIAIGTSDPTTTGLGGSAGGFTANGSITGGLAVSGMQSTFIKFKWQATALTVNQTLLVRLSINPSSGTAQGLTTGVVDTVSVTVKAV